MGAAFLYGNGGGGVALNFKVVGSTSEPSNPSENIIWINTDTTITSWAFSAEEPSSPAEGMVWISVGTSSTVDFNALKKNSIQVYPISAKQHISGAWEDKTAKTYQNGSWSDWWNGELYDAGNLYEFVTGGWTSDETTNIPEITYGTETMTIAAVSSGVNKKVRTVNKIDMSTWSTLIFDGTHENAATYNLMGLLDDSKNSVASVILKDSHNLDISSITGSYYVYFQVRDTSRPTVVSKLYMV